MNAQLVETQPEEEPTAKWRAELEAQKAAKQALRDYVAAHTELVESSEENIKVGHSSVAITEKPSATELEALIHAYQYPGFSPLDGQPHYPAEIAAWLDDADAATRFMALASSLGIIKHAHHARVSALFARQN